MSSSGGKRVPTPAKAAALSLSGDASAIRAAFEMRRELVAAQVEVLRMYLEKRPRDELLEAVERLIISAELSFREEEAVMKSPASTPDATHGDTHKMVLQQLSLLRRDVMEFERARLLGRLIKVDRYLTAHISEAIGVSETTQSDTPVETSTVIA